MDMYLLVINSLLLYGLVLSNNFARATESEILSSYYPENDKRNSNVRSYPKQRSVKMVPWNRIFKPLFPVFKGSEPHKPNNHNFHPKLLRHVKHDDLLQDSPGQLETFVCPEGYRKRIAGDTEFCSPTKTEQEIAKTESQCGEGQSFVDSRCIVAEHKAGQRACPAGSVRVVTEGRTRCVDQASPTDIKCVEGTRLINTESGWKCGPIPVSKHPFLTNKKVPLQQHQTMGFKSVLKINKEATNMPTCDAGKVAAMSEDGYICVDPVFPHSVCPENRVPSMSSRGIQCVPCPYGQEVVRTEGGVKCETSTLAMTETPCPDGLQPVHTSVGRMCQYNPSSNKRPAPSCQEGQHIELVDGQMTCIHERACPPGHILVHSENGENRCITADPTGEPSCLEGEVYYKGACISILLAGKFLSDTTSPCKGGHVLVVSNSGSVCQPITDGHVIESQESIPCGPGTIVTQTPEGFQCLQGELPLYVIPMCERDYVIARLGEMYECISVFDADLICPAGEQMVRVDSGFVCKTTFHEEYCAWNEFYHTAQDGQITCLSLLQASEICGDGYTASRKGKGFICRKLVEDISCPAGFVLFLDHENPLCIEEGVDCHGVADDTLAGCLNHVPYCQPGYSMNLDLDTPHCALDFKIEFDKPVIADPEVQPCETDGSLRPCDLPAHLLLSGCNPDCANGGTCVNGSCVCPLGVTGHACHIDVNECDSRPCEYSCENTFGSYQCVCSPGMFLSTDGRTCTDAGCIPECLNNGECVRGQCRCASGFEGQYCQTDKDECLRYGDRLCQHQCRNTYGGYTCICPPGSRLNEDARTCLNTTCIPECRNGGTCRSHRCYCPSGFYGIICQFDVNECRRNKPCDQKCENSWGSYSCSCNEGFILHTDGRSCI